MLFDPNNRAFELSWALKGPAVAALLLLTYLLGYCIYQLFFSPLRKLPGPKFWAVSYIPYVRMFVSGHAHRDILRLHRQYGPIVRVGPTHISINHPDGMQEVRGHRKTGENPKDFINARPNRDNIIGSNRSDHQRFRRALAHGFSAQSMLAQQPILKKYVYQLFEKLHEASKDGMQAIDVERWFNYTTFDVIGDLSFGEPFGCLENETYHPWVDIIFQSIKNIAFLNSSRRLSWVGPLLMMTIPRSLASKFAQNKELSREKVRKRLDLGTSRPDFIDAMIRKSESAGSTMSFEELTSNAFVLIVAGSETTATLLTAATYFLATNAGPLAKLTEEVMSAFQSEDQIDMLSVQNLTYLSAVLDESMRLYPPVPSPSPRMIGEGGDTILRHYIPEGTTVDMWQWAIYHNPAHFARTEEFIPERWLRDPEFDGDAKAALQPFSVGPRNCIGKNLANAEMRLILARLIWNFEIRATQDIGKWYDESEVYILWQKGPMNVYLIPRR
ncbi:cytochrome P450 [Colletotrichum karsti]|uniref:Cytochrome P450 n=1 Tax=Colletotrichum karsti TaxID=1095194 RepID=A0A9P6LHE6_9PEZI|nr:cytochrome P450 [Colletotrichum karsti]KAF9873493.1 cytochrome P450 [Colletotrichum karsti]